MARNAYEVWHTIMSADPMQIAVGQLVMSAIRPIVTGPINDKVLPA